MRNLRLAALFFTCMTVPVAFAQKTPSGPYGEIGLARITTSNWSLRDFQVSVVRSVVGYNLNQNFAVEGTLGVGVVDGDGVSGNVAVALKIDSMYGVYGRAKTELSPGLDAYVRAGYLQANAKYTYADTGRSYSGSTDGLSWGVGISYSVSPAVALSVDYMSYANRDNLNATGPTFGVAFKF